MSNKVSKLKPYLFILSGNLVGTVLQFLLLPVLTRIYSVDDFAMYSIIVNWSMVAYLFSTFRYDTPILQAINQEEVSSLNTFCFIGSLLVAIVSFILLYFNILSVSQEGFVFVLAVLTSCSFLGYSLVEVVCKNLLFFEDYKSVGYVRSIITVFTAISQIGLSYLFVSGEGLIFARLMAIFIVLIVSVIVIKKYSSIRTLFSFNLALNRIVFKKYINFPKVDFPSNLLNYVSSNLPYIFIPFYFGLVPEMGLYALVGRTLQAPTNLLRNSIKNVFHKEIAIRYQSGQFPFDYLLKTLWIIFFGCLPFSLLIVFFGAEIFSFLFSNEWNEAGEIASYAAFFFVTLLLRSPVQSSFQIINLQKIYFKLEFIDFFVKVFFTFLSILFYWNVLFWLKGFLIISTLMSFFIILLSLFLLRKH
tara:strand:+ start:7567 stop:8817 length:1251 start_codon:yes stop_codon:yes gene_type:complete